MSQDGTQAIRRAAGILQYIARATDDAPASLRAISQAMGLQRSTAHRILGSLTDMGLADYDRASRRYRIGMLGYELGLSVSDRLLGLGPWMATVDRVAERCKVTTYLMRRSGIEAICMHKAEGRSVIRVIPVQVGQRRYLGVGAGATALLAVLPTAEVDRIAAAIAPELTEYQNLTAEAVRAAVADARHSGFAESWGRVYREVYGLGMAIPPDPAIPGLAISIAVHASEVDSTQIAGWKRIIADEIATTATRLTRTDPD